MKKHIQSTWMRILSTSLCAVFVVNLFVGIIGYAFTTEYRTTEYFKKECYEDISQNYMLYAVDMMEQGRVEELQKQFSKLGIACSIQLVTNNPGENGEVISTTEEKFKQGEFGAEEIYELELVPGAQSEYHVNSLLGALWGYSYYADKDEWISYPIEGYIYSIANGMFYYKTSVGYFPVKYVYVGEEDLLYDYKLVHKNGEDYYYNTYYERRLDTSKYQEWEEITIEGRTLSPTIHDELDPWGSVYYREEALSPEEVWSEAYDVSGENISCPAPEYTDYYLVKLSCTNPTGNSLYVQCDELCDVLFAFEDSAIWMIVSSVVAIIVMLVLIVCSAKDEKERMNFMEKTPVIMYSMAVFFLSCGLIAILVALNEWMIMSDIGSANDMLVFAIPACVLAAWLVMNWFQNIVTRIKCKSFWKTSEFYYAYVLLKRSWSFITAPFRAVGNACRKFLHMMGENVPLFWGGLAIFVALSLLDIILLLNGWWHEGFYILLFILLKIVEVLALLFVLYQMQQLQEGSKRVATGDMSNPIDTSKMIWKFREHGENINKVSDGIAVAVEDRMKSERFKTELITNVSHDIKTPLTSIINYVDLIKKEDLQDEKVQEYVEVLDRQSARLKKLIEDLMEASKASTGNLAVSLEECDAAVLLTQLVGEFEEKLEKSQLEVVVDKPEHPVKMMADGRHMWRVFDNLLNNACKYSLPGTRVYVSLIQENNEAVITFKNISKTALNIPSEELLERFVRGDSSRNTEGSGLGLSIAQSLTELMKGRMSLSIDGDLFKVTLRFPMM